MKAMLLTLALLGGPGAPDTARVQPAYERQTAATVVDDGISTEYAVYSALSMGLGGLSIAVNLHHRDRPSRLWGLYGVLIGAYGIALGASKLDEEGDARTLGALNAGVGTAAAAVGAWTLWRSADRRARAEAGEPAPGVRVSAGPTVSAGAEPGVGVAVGIRF